MSKENLSQLIDKLSNNPPATIQNQAVQILEQIEPFLTTEAREYLKSAKFVNRIKYTKDDEEEVVTAHFAQAFPKENKELRNQAIRNIADSLNGLIKEGIIESVLAFPSVLPLADNKDVVFTFVHVLKKNYQYAVNQFGAVGEGNFVDLKKGEKENAN